MHSCIYEGRVRHRRLTPVGHAFTYKLFMMYLDLAELPQLFAGRWLWSSQRRNLAYFRRRDHLGDAAQPLDECVRQRVEEETGRRPSGPVRLLTHLSYFGYRFNPVSFYYCFDRNDERVEAIVAEINNTPWGEQHTYVLDEAHNQVEGRAAGRKKHYGLRKVFHVSPFMGMEQDYDWRFICPGQRLVVHMENYEKGERIFDATLALRRTEIGAAALARVLAQYPLITARVTAAIHWQALRLWLKRCPFYSHPKWLAPQVEVNS